MATRATRSRAVDLLSHLDPTDHVRTTVSVLFDGEKGGLVLNAQAINDVLAVANAFEVDEVPTP